MRSERMAVRPAVALRDRTRPRGRGERSRRAVPAVTAARGHSVLGESLSWIGGSTGGGDREFQSWVYVTGIETDAPILLLIQERGGAVSDTVLLHVQLSTELLLFGKRMKGFHERYAVEQFASLEDAQEFAEDYLVDNIDELIDYALRNTERQSFLMAQTKAKHTPSYERHKVKEQFEYMTGYDIVEYVQDMRGASKQFARKVAPTRTSTNKSSVVKADWDHSSFSSYYFKNLDSGFGASNEGGKTDLTAHAIEQLDGTWKAQVLLNPWLAFTEYSEIVLGEFAEDLIDLSEDMPYDYMHHRLIDEAFFDSLDEAEDWVDSWAQRSENQDLMLDEIEEFLQAVGYHEPIRLPRQPVVMSSRFSLATKTANATLEPSPSAIAPIIREWSDYFDDTMGEDESLDEYLLWDRYFESWLKRVVKNFNTSSVSKVFPLDFRYTEDIRKIADFYDPRDFHETAWEAADYLNDKAEEEQKLRRDILKDPKKYHQRDFEDSRVGEAVMAVIEDHGFEIPPNTYTESEFLRYKTESFEEVLEYAMKFWRASFSNSQSMRKIIEVGDAPPAHQNFTSFFLAEIMRIALQEAPPLGTTTYRVQPGRIRLGDVIELPVNAVARVKEDAIGYEQALITHDYGVMLLELPPDTPGIWFGDGREAIVSGEFRVADVHKDFETRANTQAVLYEMDYVGEAGL